MKVAIVANNVMQNAGGVSSYVGDLAPRLAAAGVDVTVVHSDLGYRGSKVGDPIPLGPNVKVVMAPTHGRFNRRMNRAPELTPWLRREISAFDVVDINGVWSMLAASAADACRRAGVGYVVTPHGMLTHWDWNKKMLTKQIFFRCMHAKMWRDADCVRYLTQGELDLSTPPPVGAHRIIPNAITEPSAPPPFSPREPMILFLGRIDHQKGVLELLDAFALVRKRHANARLVIAGAIKDAYGAQVRRRAAEIGSSVELIGHVWGEQKAQLFHRASIFATLSRNEGLSLATLEALSYGAPCVLTAASNLPEIPAVEAGVFTTCDPAQAAADMISLLDDRARLSRMSDNARQLMRERFSWQVVLPQVIDMYQQIADARRVIQ